MRDNQWISISDMMAGIMMIFLLIMVSFMLITQKTQEDLKIQNQKLLELNDAMSSIAKNYSNLQQELYEALLKEFGKDLKASEASIDEDNTIRFNEPEVLFDTGAKQVKKRFKDILDDFFPRYVKILSLEKFKGNIEEIRIEGHTSQIWFSAHSLEERYLGNAELSQARALEVLKYCFNLTSIDGYKEWLIKVFRANGLSFAKPLEDDDKSRRVEFRVITKANKDLLKILDISKEFEPK
ncbi:OmpA/MotB family protein [Helicobacter typhlonius]|uniref:OmpA/MotB family protein n=1 Tax=Helicobacter typhlonius TaxID=76936 RepID=UPI002FDF1C9A